MTGDAGGKREREWEREMERCKWREGGREREREIEGRLLKTEEGRVKGVEEQWDKERK